MDSNLLSFLPRAHSGTPTALGWGSRDWSCLIQDSHSSATLEIVTFLLELSKR